MNRGRAAVGAAFLAVLFAVVSAVLAAAGPAAANHTPSTDQLWVTIAINAAGEDKLSVSSDTFDDTRSWSRTASAVAVALDRPPGSFRTVENFDATHVLLRDKLAVPDERGGLSYAIDTGDLQLLAAREGFEAIVLKVCTPKVRQVVAALRTPEPLPFESPGTRCGGWFQEVEEPPIRAVVQMAPDPGRYPAAAQRVAGTAAIGFGVLGIGATLLRRGPLKRRSLASWLLASWALAGVAPIGWAVATLVLWWTGAPADPMLLSGGTVVEQMARTMLPGLAFLLPALLPAAILLTAPRRERPPPAPTQRPPARPQPPTWWPTAWWAQWASQSAAGAPPAAPSLGPAPPQAAAPPPSPQGWQTPR